MEDRHKSWAIRIGIGAGACALLTAWMVPNTTPVGRPSPLAGMASAAEASKPTYSAVPDAAIPAWAANLQQTRATPAPMQAAPAAPIAPAVQTAEAIRSADVSPEPAPPPDDAPIIAAPAASAASATQPAAPPPQIADGGYRARRAAWQARVDAVMQGQQNPGGG